MRLVIQRVARSSVSVDNKIVGEIGKGLNILIGFTHSDNSSMIKKIAEKIVKLRIFEDSNGKMNLSIKDVDGEILLIPQFTLYGSVEKGNRPSFSDAAEAYYAKNLYELMIGELKMLLGEEKVKSGVFQAHMLVEIINDGPVTILME